MRIEIKFYDPTWFCILWELTTFWWQCSARCCMCWTRWWTSPRSSRRLPTRRPSRGESLPVASHSQWRVIARGGSEPVAAAGFGKEGGGGGCCEAIFKGWGWMPFGSLTFFFIPLSFLSISWSFPFEFLASSVCCFCGIWLRPLYWHQVSPPPFFDLTKHFIL